MQMEIDNILLDYREGHTRFQIDHFIIKKQGGDYAQYKQALRELKVRSDGLREMRYNYEMAKLDLERLKNKRVYRRLKRKMKSLDIARLKGRIEDLRAKLNDSESETRAFLGIAKRLKRSLGDLDDETREGLERRDWYDRAISMIKLDMCAFNTVTRQTFEFFYSLPLDIQQEIFIEVRSKHAFEMPELDKPYRLIKNE